MSLQISSDDDRDDTRLVMVDLPGGTGRVQAELTAREPRPGGFEWLRVRMRIWYRHVLAEKPYTESIEVGCVETWVPIDAVTFPDDGNYGDVPVLAPGEGRPAGAPRYSMPWDE
ncbi:hypothetical protein [Embleya scabrispora]|uniref:hypothetical protein n=1 Tax=Embleya scabrispora TaxID=159449 RepID=UPI00131A10AF|nr:hypothetical protein [Embleya scabrispora]MYS82698.1 hypothetical protein [Streptomyces sp. SID5474]